MAPVRLAKTTFDIGLFSDNPEMPPFYESKLGLPFVEALQHSPTYAEQFYDLGGASLKINYSTEPMPAGESGYRGLIIARDDIDEPRELHDPDGLRISLVPRGHDGVQAFGIICRVGDVDRQAQFLADALGAIAAPGGVRIGDVLVRLEPGERMRASPTWCRGFNYYVVFAVDGPAAHDRFLELGAEHAVPPLRLADRCVFSWVRDPGGNWVEIVQYADIAGPLPDVEAIDGHWDEIIRWREQGVPFT